MGRERIVVGVDGSADSEQAMRWALSAARWSGADVEVIYCWAPPYAAMTTGYVLTFLTMQDISAEGNEHLDKVSRLQNHTQPLVNFINVTATI